MTTNNDIRNRVPFEAPECEFERPEDPSSNPIIQTMHEIMEKLDNCFQPDFTKRIERRVDGYASMFFNLRKLTVLQGMLPKQEGDLQAITEQAVDDGRISWDECAGMLLADLIFTGQRKTDQSNVYVLAEVAPTAEDGIIKRVLERARILGVVTGETALPAVFCIYISKHEQQLAKELGVTLINPPR